MSTTKRRNMTPEQSRYLQSELSRATNDIRYSWPDTKLPPKLALAQKQIDAFRAAERNREQNRRARIDREAAAVRKEIHFGTAESALAALEAFKKRLDSERAA